MASLGRPRGPRLAVLVAAAACAASTPALASRAVQSVPIVVERNLVRLPVSLAGSAPFQGVRDTGMPTRGVVLYRSERVDALELDYADDQQVSGAGDSSRHVVARVATVSRIDVGGLSLADVPVIVLPAAKRTPLLADGIIGSELFERFAVRVDADESRLDLFESAAFVPEDGSTIVPLHFRQTSAFVHAGVAVGDGEPIPAELAVDLGAVHALWLNGHDGGRFAAPPAAITTRLGRGLSGDVHGRVGRVRRFVLGDIDFDGVVTFFPAPQHQHPGGFDFRDGFIGAELLTRFQVTFDYAGQRMVLRRGRRFAQPFEHDMTGMVLDPSGVDRRVVDAVLPGSPADEAGIRSGDVVIAVGGEPIRRIAASRLERMFRTEGVELRVTLQRGVTTLEKRIRLWRLV